MMISGEELGKLRKKVGQTLVEHVWFTGARQKIERCYRGAKGGGDSRGLAIIGESGTGKTSVLKHVRNEYRPYTDEGGSIVPILLTEMPSKPTVKGLAEDLLAGLGDPHADKGTENAKTRRLKKLFEECETSMLMMDEFQHFVDQSGNKIVHHVADWLKGLVDATNISLVVSGLPRCTLVIESNKQLARRFQAPVEMPTFKWEDEDRRIEFKNILRAMQKTLSPPLELPDLGSDDMAFRTYLATGGLIGRLANLFVELLHEVEERETHIVTPDMLDFAAMNSSYDQPFHRKRPFSAPLVATT